MPIDRYGPYRAHLVEIEWTPEWESAWQALCKQLSEKQKLFKQASFSSNPWSNLVTARGVERELAELLPVFHQLWLLRRLTHNTSEMASNDESGDESAWSATWDAELGGNVQIVRDELEKIGLTIRGKPFSWLDAESLAYLHGRWYHRLRGKED